MIKVNNLKIKYAKELFKSVNFLLGNNEKVGLVGLNGSGKSTLLKILAGVENADGGTIEISKTEHIEYLPQEFQFDNELLVGEFLESLVNYDLSQFYRVNKILSKLEYTDYDEFQLISTLSPGQKMKLYLAKLLINNPTILLLDEPTNHLDINGIIWFEDFVKKFDGIAIIISHDRSFLNNTVDHIFEIDEEQIYIFEGNYDDYLEHKEAFKEKRAALFIAQERKRKQMDKLLESARKISDGKKRGRAVSAAKKRMVREVTSKELNEYEEKRVKSLKLSGAVPKTKKILEVKNLNFAYPDAQNLLVDVDFEIFGNEKIWLFGSNGIGKSTLIKLLIGKLKPQKGDVKWGENLKWIYFAQDEANVPLDQNVFDYFVKSTNIGFNSAYGILEKFLFDKDLIKMQIKNLSPGQKSRLAFAVFCQNEYDCMVLDEPTNHLDIKTKEVIEKALKDYKGAIILVSHDRYFSENIEPDRIITIEDKKLIQIN